MRWRLVFADVHRRVVVLVVLVSLCPSKVVSFVLVMPRSGRPAGSGGR